MATFTELMQFDPRYHPPERADNVTPLVQKLNEGFNLGVSEEESARNRLISNLKIRETLRDIHLRDNPPSGLTDALGALYDPQAKLDQKSLSKHVNTVWRTLGPERAGAVLENYHQIRRDEWERMQNEIPYDLLRTLGKEMYANISDPEERKRAMAAMDEAFNAQIADGRTGLNPNFAVAMLQSFAGIAKIRETGINQLAVQNLRNDVAREKLEIDRMIAMDQSRLATSRIFLNAAQAELYRARQQKLLQEISGITDEAKLTGPVSQYAMNQLSGGLSDVQLKTKKWAGKIRELHGLLISAAYDEMTADPGLSMLGGIRRAWERHRFASPANEDEADSMLQRIRDSSLQSSLDASGGVVLPSQSGAATTAAKKGGVFTGATQELVDGELARITAYMLTSGQHENGVVDDQEIIRQFRAWETANSFHMTKTDQQILDELQSDYMKDLIRREMQKPQGQ